MGQSHSRGDLEQFLQEDLGLLPGCSRLYSDTDVGSALCCMVSFSSFSDRSQQITFRRSTPISVHPTSPGVCGDTDAVRYGKGAPCDGVCLREVMGSL